MANISITGNDVGKFLLIVGGIVFWKLNWYTTSHWAGLFGILCGISLFIIPVKDSRLATIVGWSLLGVSLICLAVFLFSPLVKPQ
jgi:hypothetical protein